MDSGAEISFSVFGNQREESQLEKAVDFCLIRKLKSQFLQYIDFLNRFRSRKK